MEVTLPEAITNTITAQDREAGSIIRSEEEMTEEELLIIAPLAKFENDCHHGDRDSPFTMTDWRRFLTKIFQGWHSGRGEMEAVPWALTRFHETNVKVGKLKHDHPPTKNFPNVQQPPSR